MTDELTKKERRERRIVKVGDLQVFHALYGAPFEDCECGHGKRGSPEAPCPSCGRPSNSIYIKPPPQGENDA